MSRAFVKETDAVETLPERPVSEHPNYVTSRGLALIEDALAKAEKDYAAAQAAADRDALASSGRDLHYWQQRRGSADLVPPPPDTATVHFGSKSQSRATMAAGRPGRLSARTRPIRRAALCLTSRRSRKHLPAARSVTLLRPAIRRPKSSRSSRSRKPYGIGIGPISLGT
jgi:hypothetical protein